MTMTEKINRNGMTRMTGRGKKGFTLVEIVIVIAILAILSAIVIPLISTTVSAAKMSVMESDSETLDMLVKECITNAETCNRTITHGKNGVTANLATVGDICYTNNIEATSGYFTRTFDKETYRMAWSNGSVSVISGAPSNCIILSENTPITNLMK